MGSRRCRQATIAAVNGFALGGGFELALSCDFILVARGAKLGLPEIKLGLIPGGGGTQRLMRLIGPMRTKELLLSGRMISAEESVAVGAALEVVEPEALIDRALELGRVFRKIRRRWPRRAAKRVVDMGRDVALAEALSLEQSGSLRPVRHP